MNVFQIPDVVKNIMLFLPQVFYLPLRETCRACWICIPIVEIEPNVRDIAILSYVESNHFELVKWLYNNGDGHTLFRYCVRSHLMPAAIKQNNLDMVKWINAKKLLSFTCDCFLHQDYSIDSLTPTCYCAAAAFYGHLDLLKWFTSNGKMYDSSTSITAVRSGCLNVLEWATENYSSFKYGINHDIPFLNEKTFKEAAKHGNIEMMKWLKNKSCPWTKEGSEEAAKNNHFDTLKWISDNIPDNGISSISFYAATCNDNLDMFQWLAKKNPAVLEDWKRETAILVRKNGFKILCWLDSISEIDVGGIRWIVREALMLSNLNVLKWAKTKGFDVKTQIDDNVFFTAGKRGKINLLEWMIEEGFQPYKEHLKLHWDLFPQKVCDWLKPLMNE